MGLQRSTPEDKKISKMVNIRSLQAVPQLSTKKFVHIY
jgi:hypothetical protein